MNVTQPPLWLLILLVCLASHRVTRFVTRDQFPPTALPREAFVRRWARIVTDPELLRKVPHQRNTTALTTGSPGSFRKQTNLAMHSLAYLWECDWCAGAWISGLVTLGACHWTALGDYPVYVAVLTWLSAGTATGLIAQREPD